MSHADSIVVAPPGFRVTARTASVPVAALEDPDRRVYGVQFHPEVVHTSRGQPAWSETERHLLVIASRSPTGPAKVCRHQRKFDQVRGAWWKDGRFRFRRWNI